MIETPENWEVLAKSNIPQCKRCGHCTGEGGRCTSDHLLTPGQQAIVDSLFSGLRSRPNAADSDVGRKP